MRMQMERMWVVCLVWAAMVAAELRGTSGCLLKERMGLMELRKALKPYQLTPLPSDCCSWDGVDCSATTGRVQTLSSYPLDIGTSGYFLNISLFLPFEELWELNFQWFNLDGLINQPDLIKLTRLETLRINNNNLSNIVSLQAFANMKNLKYLDLSNNHMNIVDLKGICEMKNIIELDLSYNAIRDHLPHCIGNLTQLQVLKIGDNQISGNIPSNFKTGICEMKNIVELDLSYNAIRGHLPHCVGNLTQLQVLKIGDNQISGNIPSTIGNLSHLSSLYLEENYWSGLFSLHSLANNSKLKSLRLSSHHNHFQVETETQSWFLSFQLSFLYLSNSNLNKMIGSVIPTFLLHQSQLSFIDLSHNNLQGTFPSWLLQNNSKLESLEMKNNSLTGNLILPNFIFGFLKILDVSNNKIGGKLHDNLQVFLPALALLNISKNTFEGNLPSSFGALEQLQYLDLSFNSFSGKLPKTLFANNNALLFYVDFSNNLLHGQISLNLTTLPYLSFLLLRNNKFNGIIEELPSQSSSQLQAFDVSNNLISGKLANLISNFSYLEALIASNNSFEGGIPDKLCHMGKLVYLDISFNELSGSMPSCLINSSIRFLYMRNSNLSGVIPDGLWFKSSLVALDLSYNDFSNSILPNWIYSQHELQILLLAGLQLEGEISTHLCELQHVTIMDLSHNNFNGSIPACLFKMPFWVARSQYDYVDSMEFKNRYANAFLEVEFTTKGTVIRFQRSILRFMNGLDVSSNKLSGQIPPQIGDSEAIHSLNLSNNRLWGSIPTSISRLKEIESLDLSSNNLSGEIPFGIVRLNFLSTFNVSNNNLSGPTPTGGQFSNFDERNYGGNEFLCGPLLHRLCTTRSSPTTPPHEQDNDDETIFERTSFWWSFIAAYVIVFISVIVVVGIDTRLSRICFRTADIGCSKLFCVFLKLKFILGMK